MSHSDARKTGLILACSAGIVLLLWVGLLLARTRPVVGSTIRDRLAELARSHDVSLRIDSMRPAGLAGVRFEEVRVRTHRAGADVRLAVEAVEVHPSYRALLEGRIRPGRVALEAGTLEVIRRRRPDDRSPRETPSEASSTSNDTTSPDTSRASDEPKAWPVTLELRDVAARAALPRRELETRPVDLEQLTVETDLRAPLATLAARGYGQFPGGRTFAVSTRWFDSLDREGIELSPTGRIRADSLLADTGSPSRLKRWIDGLSIGRITLCPACTPRRLRIASPRFDIPGPYDAYASRARTTFGAERAEMTIDEVRFQRSGRRLPYRLDTLELTGRRSLRRADLRLELESSRRGGASVRADWREGRRLEADFEARQLHLEELWRLLELRSNFQGGVLDGALRAEVDTDLELAEIAADLSYREGRIQHDFIGETPLEIGRARFEFEGFADLGARALSVTDATLALEDTAPLKMVGSVVDAGGGWSFETHVAARDIRAPRLLDVLPRPLAHPALGAELRGRFDASLHALGHTAFPESLRLDVDVRGDVDVLKDSPYSNVFGLALAGPPPSNIPARPLDIPLRQWVSIDSLPDHVPRTIIGAEDSQFYNHRGFNWRGVRNAMRHNLEVDALERGGSTITQQLAKNLFLTRERTLARKFRELWVTWRLESALSKDRLLELYLNIVEWGPGGVRGLREAARFYFNRPPEKLTIPQTALLGAILPGPDLYGTLLDRGYLPSSRVEKVEHILSNLKFWEVVSPKEYDEIYAKAKRGEIGGLDLTICNDGGLGPPDEPAPAPPDAPSCARLPPNDG